MKSWGRPIFRRYENGVSVTVEKVTYMIPWMVWKWIVMAMNIPGTDIPKDDKLEDANISSWSDCPNDPQGHNTRDGIHCEACEASSQEAEGRHEGVQGGRPVRSGSMQERRDTIEMGSGVIQRNSGYLRDVREEGRTDHDDEADSESAAYGHHPAYCDCS